MINKLLKYDLKAIFKPLTIFYSIMIFLAISGRLLNEFGNSALTSILYDFCSGAIPGFAIGALLNNLINLWRLFHYDFYGDHAYLMRTLPLSSKTLYLSKFLTVLLTTLTTIALIILSIIVLCGISDVFAFLDNLTTTLPQGKIFLTLACLLVYLEVIFATQIGTTSVILGHYAKSNQTVWSIVIGFVTYNIISGFLLLIIFIFALFNPDIMEIFTEDELHNPEIFYQIFIITTVAYMAFITTTYLVNQKLLALGVDVE